MSLQRRPKVAREAEGKPGEHSVMCPVNQGKMFQGGGSGQQRQIPLRFQVK